MRTGSSQEKRIIRKIDHTNFKSNNTTLCTSRPGSSPFKTSVVSTNNLVNIPYPNFEYNFIEENISQSISLNYCYDKAVELYKQKKFAFASKMFTKVLEIDRLQWKAWNNLGVCYLMQKNLSEAINSFHESIKIDRTLEPSYFNIALAYLNIEKYQEASLCIKSAKSVIKNFSNDFVRLEKTIVFYGIEKQKSLLGQRIYNKVYKNDETSIPLPSRSVIIKGNFLDKSELVTPEPVLNVSTGFAQSDINEKTSFFKENEEIAKSMSGKITKLREKVVKDMKKLLKKEIPSSQKLDSKYITQEELKDIKIEFSKHPEDRNYSKIDSACTKLGFFQKFNEEIRKKVYDMCEIRCYLPGEMVFRQGDVGDHMYVIVKGAITIKKEGPEFRGHNVVVNSIYDGRQFGELALLNALNSSISNNERTASCIACEKSYLLLLPKLNYSEILLLSNKKDLDFKMNFFASLPFFKGFSKDRFMALSTNIEKTTYKLNDIILEKGQVPKGLYIIIKGSAILYTEGYSIREKFTGEYSPIRTQKPKPSPMFFSVSPPVKAKTPKLDEFEISPLQRIIRKEMKELNPEKMKTVQKFIGKKNVADLGENKHLIKDRIPFTVVQDNNFFGARAIIVGNFGNSVENTPAKFTISVQSSTLELFLFTKYHLQFLGPDLTTQMLTILEKSYEIDCPPEIDSKGMDSLFKNWQGFKSQLIKDIQKENYLNRHKNNYPFNL